ncbi:hypothetical protein Tco_0277450 [Tanacetum coccineum]
MVEVPYTAKYNVFAVDTQHSEQPECIINTCVVEKGNSNVTPDSPNMCDNEIQTNHNAVECDDEQTSRTLGESNSIRDSCLVALQNKQTEFERYKAFNDRTVNYDKLERKLNETLGLLAQKDIDIKEGLVKEKTKVITNLKLKEEKDIDKMISMENQLKFLNEIVYKRSQSIQPIHMLAPKFPTFNGRPTFANPIEIVNEDWVKHSKDHFHAPTAKDMEILIKTGLMALALKTQNDSFAFVHELKKEMHADLKYVKSLENEIDELESDKAEFSNMYDMLLQECVSNDVMCSYLHSLSNLDAHVELQCLYVHKVKEFCKEKASNVFQKEREQYFEIQDLKGQLKDKNIAISELNKLIEKMKGKSVDTNFGKQSILGKPPLKSSFAKPYDVNAPGPSKKSPKHVSFQSPKESVGSNDMVHNYYLEEAKKKA